LEIWRLSRFDRAWRQALFADVESRPTGWRQICDACIDAVDELRLKLTGAKASKLIIGGRSWCVYMLTTYVCVRIEKPVPAKVDETSKPAILRERNVYSDNIYKKKPRYRVADVPPAPGSTLLGRLRSWFMSTVEHLLAQWPTGRQLVWARIACHASRSFADLERHMWAAQGKWLCILRYHD
jgi:hypothetical protein